MPRLEKSQVSLALPDRAVPDRPAVAAVQATLVFVLSLQVARRHVGVGPDRFVFDRIAFGQVVLVDDPQGESIEDGLLKPAIELLGVIGRDQFQLNRQVKIEIDHAATGARPHAVVNISVAAHIAPCVSAVELAELVVHSIPVANGGGENTRGPVFLASDGRVQI